MRTLCLMLACALLLAESSVAGSSEHGLPGVGTFSYIGSTVLPDAMSPMVVAAK
jgi:hypothetical protein